MQGGREPGPWTGRMTDYVRFHSLELRTGDVDPVYRVLQRMGKPVGVPEAFSVREMALLSFLHVAYYDFGSALRAMTELDCRVNFDMIPRISRFRCGTERRGHRDPRQLQRHLENLFEIDQVYNGLHVWAMKWGSYGEMFGALQGIYGNGRWAAYKTSELLSWSLRPYITAASVWLPTDMGHQHSSGPRKGLEMLYARPLPQGHSAKAVAVLDEVSQQLLRYLLRLGATGTMATTETTLCDFASMVEGRYYPGHDINQMGEQIRNALFDMGSDRKFYPRDVLDVGWVTAVEVFGSRAAQSVDKIMKSHYKRTGEF